MISYYYDIMYGEYDIMHWYYDIMCYRDIASYVMPYIPIRPEI